MVVYAEYVFLNNFIIDYLLLKASVSVSGGQSSIKRLICCSIIGAIFATALPFLQVLKGVTVIKILVGIILGFLSCKQYRIKNSLLTISCLFAITFFTVGVYLCLSSIFSIKRFSVGLSLIAVIPVMLVVFFIKEYSIKIKEKQRFLSLVYDCEIIVNKVSIITKGFLDTGNRVYLNRTPVVLCGKKISEKLSMVLNDSDTYALNLTTFNGQRQIKALKNAEVKIYFSDSWHSYKKVAVGLSDRNIDYGIILHNDLFLGE